MTDAVLKRKLSRSQHVSHLSVVCGRVEVDDADGFVVAVDVSVIEGDGSIVSVK